MKLITFLFQNTNRSKIGALFILGSLTGAISTLIVYFVNSFINGAMDTTPQNTVLYFFSILVYVAVSIVFFRGLIKISEKIIKEIKGEIFSKILNSSYLKLKKNKDLIYTTLSSDVNLISESLMHLVYIIVSISTIVFCFVYMSILSWKLLIGTILVFLTGIVLFGAILRVAHPRLEKSRNLQDDIIGVLNEILKGYKELTVYPLKRKVLGDITNKNLDQAYNHRVSAYSNLSIAGILGESCSFVFLGLLLIFFPVFFPEDKGVIINFALVFLFVLKPIEVLSSLVGNLSNAEISTQKIAKLLTDFSEKEVLESSEGNDPIDFKNIAIKNLTYAYDTGFTVGPIDLAFKKNEIVFIYGGNGSGKTTFINTLLGIYTPKEITITVDDVPFESKKWTQLAKSIFAPVFSDFHVFKQNYGVPAHQDKRIKDLITLFEIDGKVTYDDTGFSTIDLSMGQRKRLALIYALLEDRPILVLDEWAADQDPQFRQKFYTEILPYLAKDENKTIIAITHDDHYYHCSDSLYKMEYGNLISVEQEVLVAH
ncbi:ATP-binding cassette domain-containing protein [Aquimarina longa]|uniref:ATP-binding cassette domain-containing protein n=1 Tax=Aquimarina longa TaxID=1080221 RepID=UPI0007864237|nr:ATP-binding cassette domain-containing protein [Aquimarina longa]